jgi:hypothetical protein
VTTPCRGISLGALALIIALGQAAAPREQELPAQSPALTLPRLAADDARVAAVAYRLSVANASLCDDTAPQAGMVVHSLLQYSRRLRPAVRRSFHIDDRPAVLAVAPQSPAARAGLAPDDALVSIDGQAVPHAQSDAAQSYADVEHTLAMLDAALRSGPARIEAQRGDRLFDVVLGPVTGCAYDAQVMPSGALNASADGRHVFIDSGLVEYAASDDDLALVLGHELAHDVLHHRALLDRRGFARQAIGNLGPSRESLLAVERQADYVGLYLTARAGYDITGAGDFWRRLARERGDPWYDHWGHPSALARARALEATRDEIEVKTKAGEPLIPDTQGIPL